MVYFFGAFSSGSSADDRASPQRQRDSRSNRYGQRDENPAQYPTSAHVTNLPQSYPGGPGGHYQQQTMYGQQNENLAQPQMSGHATSYQQQPYPQRSHVLQPTQTPEPREAAYNSRSRKNKPSTMKQMPLFRESDLKGPANIVIFGETGTGKSSLINMLSDEQTAAVSNLAVGCTFESAPYAVSIDGERYNLWDTAGLNEGDAGSVSGDQALHHLRDLVDKLKDGVSLLVYCIRGSRYRDIIKVNYDLFTEIICQGEVPVVIVVTGLENEERMEDWWTENEKEFTSRGMKFNGHACITTSKGKRNMFEEEYKESLGTVRTLIRKYCPRKAWVVDSDQWFDRITYRIQDYYDTYNGYSRQATGPYGEQGGLVREEASLFKFAKRLITYMLPT